MWFRKKRSKPIAKALALGSLTAISPASHAVAQEIALPSRAQTPVDAFCAIQAVALKLGESPTQAAREALLDLSNRASLYVRHANDLKTFRRVFAMLLEEA